MATDDKRNIEFFRDMRGLIDHDPEVCATCCERTIAATVAGEFLARGEFDFEACVSEWRKRWEQTKFFKLWQDEASAGRDPKTAFAAKRWTP